MTRNIVPLGALVCLVFAAACNAQIAGVDESGDASYDPGADGSATIGDDGDDASADWDASIPPPPLADAYAPDTSAVPVLDAACPPPPPPPPCGCPDAAPPPEEDASVTDASADDPYP